MNSILLRLYVSVLLITIMSAGLFSQVRIEKSNDKVIIDGQAYYIHIVDSSQTLYSIAKAYNVSIETISRENPSAVYGLRIDQALKIPVVEEKKELKQEKDRQRYNYHVLQRGESVYSLSRKYDIPEDEIIKSNPGINIYDMPVGTELAIPKKQFREQAHYFQTDEPGIVLHRVQEGENYATLSRQYDVSIRDIRRVNKGLLFPKEGEMIRIPLMEEEEEAVVETDTSVIDDERLTYLFEGEETDYTAVENLKGKVNVTLMLPLMLDENSKRTYIDSSEYNSDGRRIYKIIKRPDNWIYPRSELFIEFYEGALLAVQALMQKGLDVELQVFDTMRDSLRVARFMETGRLRNTDLLIGPVYPDNMEQVAPYARKYRIPVVSPLASQNTEVLRTNPYLFKVQPSPDVIQDAMAGKISEFYDHNLVFIHADTAWSADLSREFKDKIYRNLRLKIPFNDVSFREVFFTSRSSYGDTINSIDHAMSTEKPNLVILASDDESVMSEVIVNVHGLLRKYDIKLIGYPDIRWLDNLDPMYFYELGIIIFTPNWVDYRHADIKDFLKRYREHFKMEPPVRSYAWQSYDMMYYFVSGLALHGSEFMYRPSIHKPDLLQVDYSFDRTGLMNGFENNNLYLIHYTPELKVEFLNKDLR
ncbi:MAG: LysM peptidoglycan-binding domain-containing protein [Bacteroidales bacterium]|nr:LysM peptidoglycan-binding domain-containing protein [Bacteroidales bacterium]